MERPLLVILGPTGSGKSDLALFLASEFPAEIVSCDSLQVFRSFDIGTAKVDHASRERVPHHLIDVADPGETFTAGDYSRLARAAVRDIADRGKLPIVTGGTGFYLRALLEGLATAPARDEDLRTRLSQKESRRPGALHRILRRMDPGAAQRIHANDKQKLIRAIEVTMRARQPISEVHAIPPDPLRGFDVLKIGLNPSRSQLHDALNTRAEAMFVNGLLPEVNGLLASGLSGNEKPFESLGYKQALTVIRESAALEDAIASTQLETRQYAKRQMTWFRRENSVFWIDGFGRSSETRQQALLSVRSWHEHFPHRLFTEKTS